MQTAAILGWIVVGGAAASLFDAHAGNGPLPSIVAVDRVNDVPILGRAACGRTVVLLNQSAELFEIAVHEKQIRSGALTGLGPNARPRGLACLADGTLWTLESPRVLGRIAAEGRIVERVDLRQPRVALFGAADRLLFRQLPNMVGTPVLATGAPRRVADTQPWPGLVGRNGATPEQRLARNITSCGIASAAFVPCWFADTPVVTVSDGNSVRSYRVDVLAAVETDQQLPIWDVALLPSGDAWILGTAVQSYRGRRVGGLLAHVDRSGTVRYSVSLVTPARLIVSAAEESCLLLTADGQLAEVRRP